LMFQKKVCNLMFDDGGMRFMINRSAALLACSA